MNTLTLKRLLVLCLLAAGAEPALAHHSFAMFDMSKTLTLAGTVTNFEWTNPHSWLWIQVPDGKGGSQLWGLEGQAPGEMIRHGWTRHSINVGDKISVQIHPLKDGELGGSFGTVTLADGTVLMAGMAIGTPPPGVPPPSQEKTP
jgi:hypothetical protein